MNDEKLQSALKSIGKKSFVEDFEVYSNQTYTKSNKIEILSKKYSRNDATIKVSFADDVLKSGKEKEALEVIINSSIISRDVREQARFLLNNFN